MDYSKGLGAGSASEPTTAVKVRPAGMVAPPFNPAALTKTTPAAELRLQTLCWAFRVSCGSACRPQRVYEGKESAVESLLGTSQRPRRAAALHQASTQIFVTLGMRVCLGRRVGGGRQGAAHAEHKERNNECWSSHNATVFEPEVRGHVWLCARLPWTDGNKETFEGTRFQPL